MTAIYPHCGCPPDGADRYTGAVCTVANLVCRNADCIDYGTHRRGLVDDCCNWCGEKYTPLALDPLRGAR
jgi:hypothetical protein